MLSITIIPKHVNIVPAGNITIWVLKFVNADKALGTAINALGVTKVKDNIGMEINVSHV